MIWRPNYEWLESFWTDVITDRPGRIWQVNALFEGDLWLRDAYAWGRLRDRLRERGPRVEYAYVRAWWGEPPIQFQQMASRDLIFLGRTKAFASSRFAPYAYELGNKIAGRFIDGFDGRLGNSVAYGRRVFMRRDIESPPDHYRRTDVDYAVLGFRTADVGFETRRLLVLSGVSTLGTLALTLALVDDERRRELVRQVRELAPWRADLRPEESFELCVRVEVDRGEAGLENFLNDPEFATRVEVVAIAGDEPHVRQDSVELVLRPGGTDAERGTVSIRGAAEVPVTKTRFNLLRSLVTRDGSATDEQLCEDLKIIVGGPREATKKEKALLAKMVHDLNATLARIPGLQGRVIQKRERRYLLTGVRGVVRP